MNRLEDHDICEPRDYDEYLEIHKRLEEADVRTLKTYRQRLQDGSQGYRDYPKLYWDRNCRNVAGSRARLPNRKYNHLTVAEFLMKAGASHKGCEHKYKTGDSLKHMFI